MQIERILAIDLDFFRNRHCRYRKITVRSWYMMYATRVPVRLIVQALQDCSAVMDPVLKLFKYYLTLEETRRTSTTEIKNLSMFLYKRRLMRLLVRRKLRERMQKYKLKRCVNISKACSA